MDKISFSQAAKLLDISVDDLGILEKRGLIHSSYNKEGEKVYSAREIAQIKSRQSLTLSEAATQVAAGMQREMVASVTKAWKVLIFIGGVFLGYASLVIIFIFLFIASPLQTASWLGIVDVSSLQTNENKQVLGAETSIAAARNSPLMAALQPIGKVSLGLVKNISPDSYAQVSKVAIIDPSDVLTRDINGELIPIVPFKVPSSHLKLVDPQLVTNLNSQYLQGKQPGTSAGDIAIVGETANAILNSNPVSENPSDSELTDPNLLGLASISNANLVNSSITIETSGPISGGGVLSLGEKLTLSCPTCFTGGSLFTAASTDTLTNKTINGLSNTISGLSSLNFSSADISQWTNNLGFITAEADTLANVSGRGSSTSTELILNGGITTTGSTGLTLNTGTTGEISIGTGTNAKTITIGNITSTSAVNINAGTGNINFNIAGTDSSGKVQIGTSGTATPDLLVLDNGTADPVGVNGGMYYNTTANKFRCYQNGAWSNCIGSSGTQVLTKNTDQAVTSNTTLTDETTLQFSIAAGESWIFKYDLFVANTSSAQPDWKSAIVGPTGSTCSVQLSGIEAAGGNFPQRVSTDCTTPTAMINTAIGSDAGNGYNVWIQGIITAGATAGTVKMQFAQNVLSASSLTVKAGSIANAYKVGGADLAEAYRSDDFFIVPGDVVAIDNSLENGVKKSKKQYDPTVLGIVSTQPGMVLGDNRGEGALVLVALSGRVPVKVSRENGAIRAGDYLTSSSTPGVAMKATKAGTIIGTAMTSFDGEGIGQVIVFVKNGSSIGSNFNYQNEENVLVDDKVSETSSSSGESIDTKNVIETNILDQITKVISDVFKNTIEFFGNIIFHTDVTFLGRPTFNKDTAGHALIRAGENEVSIKFEKEYIKKPVVVANINLIGTESEELPGYAIYDSNTQGFKIRLSKIINIDLSFSWIALAVDSEDPPVIEEDIVKPTETSTPIPTPQPTEESKESSDVITPTITPTPPDEQHIPAQISPIP